MAFLAPPSEVGDSPTASTPSVCVSLPPATSIFVPAPPDDASSSTIPHNAAELSNASPLPSGIPGPVPVPTYTGGHITISPDALPSGQLNPRSCVTCRRRKVRCDKQMPCSNCRRAHTSCVFPAPGRAPRRPRPRDPNAPSKQGSTAREAELMHRLRKLEGIVEELSGQIEVDKHSTTGSGGGDSPEGVAHSSAQSQPNPEHIGYGGMRDSRPDSRPDKHKSGRGSATAAPVAETHDPSRTTGHLQGSNSMGGNDFGRLVLNKKGNTRYVSNLFWSKLNDELDQLREETHRLSDEDSDISEDEPSPPSISGGTDGTPADQAGHQCFLFGYSSSATELRTLHPLVSQIPFLWQVFQENVDPLVKILHIPTMNSIIRDMRNNMDSLTPATEALMFSIYYAAITSMDADEVKATCNAERPVLIKQYRFALEQALAKASFLTSPDLVVLQAFVLFLVLVRRHDDTRFSWTLTGLAIRIAHSLGIHRDGVHFPDLTPFEIEMRRRLWWAICILDLRSAEDQGTDLTILDRLFDTELPLNINDADITSETKIMPAARDTHTDITFSLIRYEICVLARRMHTATSSIAPTCPQDAALTLEMREQMLIETHERLNRKYFKYGTATDNPMYWVAATVARLILAKLSLIIHQPVLFPQPGTEVSRAIRDRLFVSSMEIVEYNLILHTEPRTKQWRWLFQTYTQWHAVAYLMVDICRRPWTPIVERAWTCLTATFNRGPDLVRISGNTTTLLPLRKLLLKTRRHREAEAARLRADPEAAERLRASERVHVPVAKFGVLPTCVNTTMSLMRWKELVSPNSKSSDTPGASGSKADGIQPLTLSEPPFTEGDIAPGSMNLMETIMSGSVFDPTDLFPVIFPVHEGGDDLSHGEEPHNARRFPPATAGLHGAHSTDRQSNGRNVFSQAGLPPDRPDDSTMVHPPPWLWSDPLGTGQPSGPGSSTVVGLPVEEEENIDHDVNMDVDVNIEGEEDFDWDVFHESIKSYDMDVGLSTAFKTACDWKV